MGVLKVIGDFLRAIMFFIDLWHEKRDKEAAEKAEVAKEIVDAFKETDKAKRASRLNAVIGGLRG